MFRSAKDIYFFPFMNHKNVCVCAYVCELVNFKGGKEGREREIMTSRRKQRGKALFREEYFFKKKKEKNN